MSEKMEIVQLLNMKNFSKIISKTRKIKFTKTKLIKFQKKSTKN